MRRVAGQMTRDFEADFARRGIEAVAVPMVMGNGQVSQQFWHVITQPAFAKLTEWHAAVTNYGQPPDRKRLTAIIQIGRLPWLSNDHKGAASDEKAAALVAKRWVDALARYPEWVVIRAFKAYERQEHYPPKIADIVTRCDRIWPHAHLAGKVAGILDRVAEVKPEWAQ